MTENDTTTIEEVPTEEQEVVAETKTATAQKSTPEDGHWWWGTGRRKASVARVRIRPGDGTFNVNTKDLTEYFSELRDHQDIMRVLEKTNTKGSIDIFVKTNGGGYTGQAGAIILNINEVIIPNFVEQGFGHDCFSRERYPSLRNGSNGHRFRFY